MKRSIAIALLGAILLSSYTALPNQAAASTTTAIQSETKGFIESGVNFRDKPSLSGRVIGFLKKGSEVTVLAESNSYFYKVKTQNGTIGYVSSADKYISVAANAEAPAAPGQSLSATVIYGVNLRNLPSTSGDVVAMLRQGTQLAILEKSNAYFYKVRTTDGKTGYVSTADKYLEIGGQVATPVPVPVPSPVPTPETTPVSQQIEQVIQTGMKYLGTPYEYSSDRDTTATFDCSDFVRQAFKEAVNLVLPADSRGQGDWIKNQGRAVYNISSLKRGDLVFFMSYKGSSASAYEGIDKANERITHVAIYLGNGQLLHTYSAQSGGVKISTLEGSWVNRFLFGGSAIK